MSNRLPLLALVIVSFGILTAVALMDGGIAGIFAAHASWGGRQVLVDLVIVCGLACIWMVQDARARGANAWPFVVLTLLAGSFGPLFYLVSRELGSSKD